ncbi:hypothetical protein THRCLA_20293 [Thraustotheca clavata]|uniref:HAT C-terminal dimerisation domain-containing protein n=1 Tax=Thraustotheca clavata TaxID=74557 RepID=A0A1W0A9R7_9STRA|nr:hypothetical protein THRCLA_20293 [Thraustotheca clavata]
MERGFLAHPRPSDGLGSLKAKLQASLSQGDDEYIVKSNPGFKKAVCWQRFGHIYYRESGELVKLDEDTAFVACYVCRTVYSFKSKNGTTTIMAHRCLHERKTKIQSVEKPRKIKNPELDALKKEIHHALTTRDTLVGYTLEDNSNATKSECWKKFAYVFLNGIQLHAFDSAFVACRECFVVYQYKVRNGTSTMTTHVCGDDNKRSISDENSIENSSKRMKVTTSAGQVDAIKQAIANSLQQDGKDYTLLPNPNERNAVCWQRFGFFYRDGNLVSDENQENKYVGCYDCNAIYIYKGDTAQLLAHICSRQPSEKLKDSILTASLSFIQNHNLPLDLLESNGFQRFLQHVFHLGKSWSRPLDALLPDMKNIQTKLKAQTLMIRTVLSARLMMLSNDSVSFGLSVFPMQECIVVTAHFIDSDFELHDRILNTHPTLDGAIDATMALYNISPKILPFTTTFVSWNQSQFHQCPILVLNGILTTIFNPKLWPKVLLKAYSFLSGDEPTIEFLSKIECSIASSNKVSLTWPNVASTIGILLAKCNENIPSEVLLKDELLEFQRLVELFIEATKAFEQKGVPTIHTACYWKHALSQYCSSGQTVAPVMERIKAIALHLLDKWELTQTHILAALLDPGQKRRLHKFGVDTVKIAQAKDELKLRVDALTAQHPMTTKKSKKNTHAPSILSMYGDSSEDEAEIQESSDADTEISKYFDCPLLEDISTDLNPLLWWKCQQKRWPFLSKVARSVLCLPASIKPTSLKSVHPSEFFVLLFNRDLLSASYQQESFLI